MKPKPRCRTKSSSASGKSTSKKHLTHRKGAYYYGYVMRNGNDYYIIDMALAENSALNDCVPSNRLRAYPQQWLPGESNS